MESLASPFRRPGTSFAGIRYRVRVTKRLSRDLDPPHLFVLASATPSGIVTTTAEASPAATSSFCVAGFLLKNRAKTIASRTAYGRTFNGNTATAADERLASSSRRTTDHHRSFQIPERRTHAHAHARNVSHLLANA